MTINHIQHVGIPTQKLEETIEFYQGLGFQLINLESNGSSKVAFLQLGDDILEFWESSTTEKIGAIHHIALDTDAIEAEFLKLKADKRIEFIDEQIKFLPFWEHGIKYFNFYGPNREIIEICQVIKE